MARKTDIQDILFPVDLKPIYTEMRIGEKTIKVNIPNSQVAINLLIGEPLGVVSKEYRLVTNQQKSEIFEMRISM